MIVVPWAGPAIHPETGDLAGPLPPTCLIATSVGWPKTGVEEIAMKLNEHILATLWESKGMLAATLAISPKSWNAARNIVIWENKKSLGAFLASDAHRAASLLTRDLMWDWEGTSWAVENGRSLPEYSQARERLTVVRGTTDAYASLD